MVVKAEEAGGGLLQGGRGGDESGWIQDLLCG